MFKGSNLILKENGHSQSSETSKSQSCSVPCEAEPSKLHSHNVFTKTETKLTSSDLQQCHSSTSDFKSKKISSILKTTSISQGADLPPTNNSNKMSKCDADYNKSHPFLTSNEINEKFSNSLKKQKMSKISTKSADNIKQTNGLDSVHNASIQTGIKNETKSSANLFLKSFTCQQCGKDFFYENHLRKHILSKHTVTPLYACSHCSQGFSTRSTAKSHVENSHVVNKNSPEFA